METTQNHKPKFIFYGNGGDLFRIQIINLLLKCLTLGLYHCWAKTNVRKYILSQMEFEGDRLAYHGTGKELFRGFLKAALIFGGITALSFLSLLTDNLFIKKMLSYLPTLAIFLLIPIAMIGGRRYYLSKISWRGIRFSFRGKIKRFIIIYLKGAFLRVLTLGFYGPFYSMKKNAFLTSHTYFGNKKFQFDGDGWDIFNDFVKAVFLTLPTLGLYWFWYSAKKERYIWSHTSLEDIHFSSTVTGGKLLQLQLVNALIFILTLGFGLAWVKIRNIKFATNNLSIEGGLALATIQQEAQNASPAGDELGGLLDLELDVGGA